MTVNSTSRWQAIANNGVLVTLAGMLMFSLNDVLGKFMVATYPVGEVVMIRSVSALLVLTPFIMAVGWKRLLFPEKPKMQATRAILSTAEVMAFYAAVAYLPLADVMTYWLAAPIYVAAISPFVLGEQVGWRRWTAILVGFAGVVIALQPSGAMFNSPATIISIFGTMAFAFMMLSGRSLRGTPDSVLVFWQIAASGIAGLVWSLFDWVTPSLADLGKLALLGVVASAAHVLVNRALKLADAATVAPLQYSLLFWAILFGWIFFGDLPTLPMMIGAVLIVGSGLFIFFREVQLKKREKVLAEVPELP